MGARRVNGETLELIKRWEGLRLEAYKCPAGVWTIGYGHTRTAREGMRITEERAEELLREDLREFEELIERVVRVPLTDNQFGALVSWAFNVGSGRVRSSTLVRVLNEGKYEEVPRQLALWNKVRNPATGRLEVSRGLANRRAAEAGLWARGAHVAGREVEAVPPNPTTLAEAVATGTGTNSGIMAALAAAAPVVGAVQGMDWRLAAVLCGAAILGYVVILFARMRRA